VVYVQLKATDYIERYTREENFSYVFEKAHLDIWLNEPMPVIIVLFDAQNEVAYWVYLQAYFEQKEISLLSAQKTFTIYFDQHNIVSRDAVKKWQAYKNHVLAQIDGRITHHA
jgi:predicted enzyme involved in methoxymalonyl-ACP biosynthesis